MVFLRRQSTEMEVVDLDWNGWKLEDEVEQYQAKIQFKKMLLGWHVSKLGQEIQSRSHKLGTLKEETKTKTQKLGQMCNLPAIGCEVATQIAHERCLDLGNKLNELTRTRKTKEDTLKNLEYNLKATSQQLEHKREELRLQRKAIKDLQAKLDGILLKQKEEVELGLQQNRMHDELQRGNLAFKPLLQEMDRHLKEQNRDMDEFRTLLKAEASRRSMSEGSKEQVKLSEIQLLKQTIEQTKICLTKEKQEYESTLRQLEKTLVKQPTLKSETLLGDAESVSKHQMMFVEEIGEAASRILNSLMKTLQIGQSNLHANAFIFELLSISRICSDQITPRMPSNASFISCEVPSGWQTASWHTLSTESVPYSLKRCQSVADLVIDQA